MTLTREEILAMKPGPELDKMIAEHVMGWSIYRYDKDVPERCYYMLVDKSFDPIADDGTWNAGERKTEEEAWKDNRPFSTDISAAWEVADKLKIAIIPQSSSAPDNLKYLARAEWDFRQNEIDVFAETAPEAISKVALLAVLKL